MNYSSAASRSRQGRVGGVRGEVPPRVLCRYGAEAASLEEGPPSRRWGAGRGGSTSPLTPLDPPPQAQALRGQIQILADSRKSVGDVSSRLVDDRNDLGIGQPA